MELDELLALMATTIYAADAEGRTGSYAKAAERAVGQAEMLWKCVINRGRMDGKRIVYPYRSTDNT